MHLNAVNFFEKVTQPLIPPATQSEKRTRQYKIAVNFGGISVRVSSIADQKIFFFCVFVFVFFFFF
jgi:hypothetical protein